jgi:methyl-accepting chemotaxis protein
MSRKTRKYTLAMRLIIYISITVLLELVVFTLVTAVNTLGATRKNAQELSASLAEGYANEIRADIQVPMDAARTLAQTIEGSTNSPDGNFLDRDGVNAMLKNVIERNADFFGTAVLFEPNAFDHSDAKYANTPGHDETGRFIPYWTRNAAGKGEVSALVDYEVPGAGDWYLIPKKTNRECVLDPFIYRLNGTDVLMTSLVCPVRNAQGAFIGVTDVDMALDSLQQRIVGVKINGYPDAFINVYSQGGIVVADRDASNLGKSVAAVSKDERFVKAVLSNAPYFLERRDPTTGIALFTAGYRTRLGKTDSSWTVEINLPKKALLESGYALVRLLIIVGILSLFMAIAIVILYARTLTKPIINTAKKAGEIAGGELRNDLTQDLLRRTDEIGDLANSLQNMMAKLREVIAAIDDTSGRITSGSGQLSGTSQQLSQGATEQAASVEEISSSMEQMTSNIRQNADNAAQTEQLAKKAASAAERGGVAVSATVDAMKQIASKIGIIEEIARSTNMLSLNASIEAARAGEYGKGFAVVAAEVGKLAERSQKESGEISKLSKESVSVAENAGAEIAALIPDIRRTSELVQEISAASNEQSAGASQINGAILQLDQVVQQNAAAAEEAASMSEELAGLANVMAENVSFFRTGKAANGTTTEAASAKVAIETATDSER